MCFAPRWVHKVPTNLLTFCVPLAVRRYDGIPHGTSDESKKVHATAFVTILAVCMALVSFEFLSVMITICRLYFVVLANRFKIFIATNSNSPVAEKSCSWHLCLSVLPALVQLWQLLTVLNILIAIFGQ